MKLSGFISVPIIYYVANQCWPGVLPPGHAWAYLKASQISANVNPELTSYRTVTP
ncbi:hypothetical protein D9X30_4640 (plasmid) [Cupriavidus sp. U2]|nr:hypothetical protein D9X30_4640 [Cupriavidus sp. U2]